MNSFLPKSKINFIARLGIKNMARIKVEKVKSIKVVYSDGHSDYLLSIQTKVS